MPRTRSRRRSAAARRTSSRPRACSACACSEHGALAHPRPAGHHDPAIGAVGDHELVEPGQQLRAPNESRVPLPPDREIDRPRPRASHGAAPWSSPEGSLRRTGSRTPLGPRPPAYQPTTAPRHAGRRGAAAHAAFADAHKAIVFSRIGSPYRSIEDLVEAVTAYRSRSIASRAHASRHRGRQPAPFARAILLGRHVRASSDAGSVSHDSVQREATTTLAQGVSRWCYSCLEPGQCHLGEWRAGLCAGPRRRWAGPLRAGPLRGYLATRRVSAGERDTSDLLRSGTPQNGCSGGPRANSPSRTQTCGPGSLRSA
jgi:hypothetical protein